MFFVELSKNYVCQVMLGIFTTSSVNPVLLPFFKKTRAPAENS